MPLALVSVTNSAVRHPLFTGKNKNTVIIGRQEDCDIQIDKPQISKRHTLLSRIPEDPESVAVRDIGSTNGTFINGAIIPVKTEGILHLRQVLRFGSAVNNSYQLESISDSSSDSGSKTEIIKL